ncbi:MAG: ribosomal RNA small subunit methyltransferase A [Parcubacteria group bacterium]|nr:ribosomal RNA small subunit methyltransferase A [Parcubacteria group bacterium]
MDETQIKKLLQKYNIRPNKRMGQNFLIDKEVLEKIINTADLTKDDTVLEIGSGLGTLTKKLAEEARKVITIEKDKQIVEALKEILGGYKNVEIIQGDVLDLLGAAPSILGAAPKIVSNIPYYLTSPLIRMFLELENQPKEIILLIQKEVAERICAELPKMNLLAISVQFYSKPEIISYVSKSSFWPEPKVDSAIIKIANIRKPENINIKKFFKLVKAGFSHPRKQLANNLSKKLNLDKEQIKRALAECNLNIQARAQNLLVKDWESLSKKLL